MVGIAGCTGTDSNPPNDVGPSQAGTASPEAVESSTCGAVETLLEPGFTHVLPGAEVTYSFSPPTSGAHPPSGAPAPGAYDEPIDPVRQVTALGGGAVLVQYDRYLPDADIDTLRALVDSHEDLVVAPVGAAIDGGSRLAATAWGVRLRCDVVELDALDAFISDNAGVVHLH